MIVLTRREQVLVDREALAKVAKRKVPTIIKHCRVVRYHSGRAMYALEESLATLAEVPTRRRNSHQGDQLISP